MFEPKNQQDTKQNRDHIDQPESIPVMQTKIVHNTLQEGIDKAYRSTPTEPRPEEKPKK